MGRGLLICAVLTATACAPTTVSTPLPHDVVLPKATTGFNGTWIGSWGQGRGSLDHTLVVEKSDGSSAMIIYSWGTAPASGILSPGFVRATATVSGNLLKATLPNGAEVSYKLSADQQWLDAQYILRGSTTLGALNRLK